MIRGGILRDPAPLLSLVFPIGEAPGPFMYVCVGTLILSATIAHLLTLGARTAKSS